MRLINVFLFVSTCNSLVFGQTIPTDVGATHFNLNRSFANQPIPIWQNGYLIGIGVDPSSAPVIFAYDKNGNKLFEVPLQLEKAARLQPTSMAASGDGTFAVSGSAYSTEGYGTVFIAMLDIAGRVTRLIRTETFAPLHLAFTEDGTLWAAGRRVTYPSPGRAPDHPIIQAYKKDGSVRFSGINVSTFHNNESKSHPVRMSFLATNGNHIVLFCVDYNEMLVISQDGTLVERVVMKPPSPNHTVTGLAVGSDLSIVISCMLIGEKNQNRFAFYRRDSKTNTWSNLYSRSFRGSGFTAIYGAGPQGLLVASKLPQLQWMTIKDLQSHR